MKFPEANTPKLVAIAGLQALSLYVAFEKIFFQTNGLSLIEIAILGGVFSAGIIALEVPSGALSDRWMRTRVMTISVVAAIATAVTFALSTEFWHFVIGTVFAVISFVCDSGTNSSLLYDSLKEAGAEKTFEKFLAVRRVASGIGYAAGAIIGGYVAQWYGIVATMWATLIPLSIALVLTLSLREPHFHKTTGELNYFSHIREAAKHLVHSRYYVQVIALSVVIKTVLILIGDYSQLYFVAIGFSLVVIGFLTFLDGLKEIVGNIAGSYASAHARHATLYGVCLVVMTISLLVTAWQPNVFGVVGLFLASSMFFIIDVPLLGDFHRTLHSSMRATSESFLNLVTESTKVIIALGFAYFSHSYSIALSFGLLGCCVLIYTCYYYLSAKMVFIK